jgi:hypothetical protein
MSSGISGSYDGEGPNVAAKSATAPGPTAQVSPDIWAQGAALNSAPGGQGRQGMCRVDRRGRLRTADEAARSGTAISVGGGDQILNVCTRWVYIASTGNLVVRLADDTADTTLSNLPVGVMLPLAVAIVRQTGTTAGGVLLF